MKKLEDLGKVLTTDVLVIGGGIAGIPAALKAREEGVDVLIVDKAHVGFAGMAPRGGNGILALPMNENDPKYSLDIYTEFVTRSVGKYLNDQKALDKFAKMIYPTLKQLQEWGVQLSTDKDGEIAMFPFGDSPLLNTGINLNANENMRKTAEKNGVKIQNGVNVSALIRVGDRVIGAVGYDIVDGTFYVFKAKTVIVACGASEFKASRMFTNNGEGNKLCFDVGAQARSAEFAFVEITSAAVGETIHGGHTYIYNQKGENLWKKHVHTGAVDVCAEMILGMVKEIEAGNGPLYCDLDIMHNDPAWIAETLGSKDKDGPQKLFPDKISWTKRTQARDAEYLGDMGNKPEVTFTIHGNLGFVRVDENMKTTVKGLYSAGIDNGNGSAINGSAPQPADQRGGCFMYAIITGEIAGTNAAQEAKGEGSWVEVPVDLAAELKEKTFAPMHRKNGPHPREMLARVQDASCPIEFILKRSEKSINKAIGMINDIKKDLAKMSAADYHELKLCSEVEAMALSTEVMLRSALARTESRDFHYREDYPERDDKNWLKWVLADNVDGEVVISTEDVPIQEYKYQPASA